MNDWLVTYLYRFLFLAFATWIKIYYFHYLLLMMLSTLLILAVCRTLVKYPTLVSSFGFTIEAVGLWVSFLL